MLTVCPNCGVAAIPLQEKIKPKQLVQCNNCHEFYTLQELREELRKLKKNML